MFKHELTFENFLGEENTDTFYFHLSKGELVEWAAALGGDPISRIDLLAREGRNEEIVDVFKQMIKKSYGVPSFEDGRFIKNEQVFNDFVYSGAFNEMVYQMMNDVDLSIKFTNGVIPSSIRDKVVEARGENPERPEIPVMNRAMRRAQERQKD